MEPPETIEVDATDVSCDGGGGALGHPCVYLKIGPEGWVECPYCDRRFVFATNAPPGAGH
ncbi:MAG: zinc-finger domain-containing protein [Alphaproteobacteria bacterium]